MKRIIPLLILLIVSTTVSAQLFKKKDKTIESQYQTGAVTLDDNNRVTFSETIEANGLTAAQIKEKADRWFETRFVEPTVIGVKSYETTSPNTIEAKVEEYIIFKKKFLVLDRSRINYFLTITCEDGKCLFNMSRITYWYDDEDPKGGLHMKAEDWITDENAFNNKQTTLKKFPGKFRRKTIDLKNTLIQELKNELTIK